MEILKDVCFSNFVHFPSSLFAWLNTFLFELNIAFGTMGACRFDEANFVDKELHLYHTIVNRFQQRINFGQSQKQNKWTFE